MIKMRYALENRAEEAGVFALVNGQWVQGFGDLDKEDPNSRFTYVDSARLTYEMENGKLINRRYNIWVDNDSVSAWMRFPPHRSVCRQEAL